MCVYNVVLDLGLRDGNVLQNDLQPHRHHARHPVDQAGTDVTGHPPLKAQHRQVTQMKDPDLWGFSVSLLFSKGEFTPGKSFLWYGRKYNVSFLNGVVSFHIVIFA